MFLVQHYSYAIIYKHVQTVYTHTVSCLGKSETLKFNMLRKNNGNHIKYSNCAEYSFRIMAVFYMVNVIIMLSRVIYYTYSWHK